MPKRNLVWVIVVFAFFVLCVKADNPARQTQRGYYENFETLAVILRYVTEQYVHEVEPDALFEGMAQGMMSQLDPYCNYIPPRLKERFEKDVHGRFGGIGIRIGLRNNMLTVISPLEGTPAFRAGVLAGDTIIKINGESTEGITLDQAVERLTGEPGTKVTITVIHEGQTDPVDITITRARIVVPTVAGYRRTNGGEWDFFADRDSRIGYVRVVSFSDDTLDALDAAVRKLLKEDMRGLVLDLRFNPGGLLRSAVQVADRFLDEGVIVTTRGRGGREIEQKTAKPAGTYPDFPLVVLVNRYSASAAEIVAGALQYHHRAVILGERTFGKGSVQSVIELGEGRGAIKLTTAEYYLPDGRNINRPERLGRGVKRPPETPPTTGKQKNSWGVKPDIEVVLSDEENRQLLTERREAEIIHHQPATRPAPASRRRPPGKQAGQEPKEPKQPPFLDRQLQRALDVLKAYRVWEKHAARDEADAGKQRVGAAQAAQAAQPERPERALTR